MGSMALKIHRLKKTASCIRIMMCGMHFFPDAGHIQKGRRRNFFHVFLEGGDAFGKIDGVAAIHGENQGKHPFGHVAERENRDDRIARTEVQNLGKPLTMLIIPLWLIMAPLGSPVVPEV